jgi:hypothetical protein
MSLGSAGLEKTFARLKLREGTSLERKKFKPFSDPVFIRAIMLLFAYGCVSGFMVFMQKAGIFGRQTSDCYAIALHLIIFIGGLAVFGALNFRRAALILISIPGFQLWEYYFYDTPKLYVFYPAFACWVVFYLAVFDPELMAKFGIRKGRMASDIAKSALAGFVVLAYTVIFVSNWGFPVSFDFWKVAPHFAVMWSQALIQFSFIFAVWNRHDERGLTTVGTTAILLAMISAVHLPYFAFFSFLGTIPIQSIIGGFIAEALLMTLVMSLTFKRMRTSFAVCFVMSAMNEVLLMAGII